MNITNLLEQGVSLMLLGMGMVFFILILLILTINVVSAVIVKFEPVVADKKAKKSVQLDQDTMAAITIAIQRFRSK